jgi:hypothetical protein
MDGTHLCREAHHWEGSVIGIAVSSHSKLGAPALLTISDHPAIASIVVSRDLGDASSRIPTLSGMPCLLLNFKSEAAADEALGRLSTLSRRLYRKLSPTQIDCGGDVHYSLRMVHGFDEATITEIERLRSEAVEHYEAAQHAYLHGTPRRGRR